MKVQEPDTYEHGQKSASGERVQIKRIIIDERKADHARGNNTNILQAIIEADEGRIHEIDAVLIETI